MRHRFTKLRRGIVGLGTSALCLVGGTAAAQSQPGVVGMNLNKLSDFSRQWVFVDAFKMSRPWVDGSFNSGTLALDAQGWVTSLQPGQVAQALMFFDNSGHYPSTPNCQSAPSADNCYVLKFEGTGTITFGGGASIVSNPSANRFFVNVPAQTFGNGGITLRLTATSPANPVKNIRFIMAGFEATADSNPFHPTFLARLAPFKVIRFMDFGATNNTDIQNFSQRKTLLSATQVADDADGIDSNDRGVAYEYMVDLCNQLDADMWLNVPHRASDDYVTRLALLVSSRLEPGRRVYVEWSNEVWNPQFLQGDFAQSQGLLLGLDAPRNNAFISRLRFQARRSVQVFDIFEGVFGGTQRLVRVIATQAANAFTAQETLDFENAFLKTDALAIAPYMDGGGRVGRLPNLTSLSVDQVIAELRIDLVGTGTDQVKKMMQDNVNVVQEGGGLVNAKGVPLRIISYEGGQHLLALGPNSGSAAANTLLDAVNRASGMRDLYRDYLCQWREITGGDVFTHFNDVFGYGPSGRWGALEFQDQDPNTAPKFLGLTDYVTNPGCTSVPAPTLSIADVSQGEGNSGTTNFTFTVSSSTPAPGTITVRFATAAGTATAGTDFSPSEGTLTFSAGQSARTIAVGVTGETTAEGNETFLVNLSSPTGASLADAQAVGTIVNDDVAAAPLVAWSTASQSVAEGGTATLTVNLSSVSAQTVTVPFTVSGTASAGSDHSLVAGAITVIAGASSGSTTFNVVADSVDEESETVVVTLGSPTNAILGTPIVQTVSIIDEDDAPLASWTPTAQSVSESVGTVTLTAQLTAASGQPVVVPYTVSGTAKNPGDHSLSDGTLTFAAGATTASLSFTVANDAVGEDSETVVVTLRWTRNAGLATSLVHTVTITDDDPVPSSMLSIEDRSVREGAAVNAAFRILLSAPSAQTVTVDYATADVTAKAGSDYTSTSGTLTLTPGRTEHSIFVPIISDGVGEGAEAFVVNLSNAANARIADGLGQGTIDDPPATANVPMFRAYNASTDYHFFTTDDASRQFAVNVLGFRDESNPVPFFVSNVQLAGTTPLFRLYNPNLGRHFYTPSTASRDFLMGLGVVYEKDEGFIFPLGTSPQPAGTAELFLLFNNNSGTHLFTADPGTKDLILSLFPGIWEQHTSVGLVFTGP